MNALERMNVVHLLSAKISMDLMLALVSPDLLAMVARVLVFNSEFNLIYYISNFFIKILTNAL